MIKYRLRCAAGCEFEGWFSSMADYDRQAEMGLLECPACGVSSVDKAIMAPAVAGRRRRDLDEAQGLMRAAAEEARAHIEKHFDYVGDRFPEEARAIHYGEKADRQIYGEASVAEVKSLINEGVSVAPVPGTPKPDQAAPPQAAPAPKKRAKSSLN